MSPAKIGLDKITGTVSKLFTNMHNMHPGKKLYASLWGVTGIFLIVEIALQIAWSNMENQTPGRSDAIAAILILLIISMFAAIFTTVIVSLKLKRDKNWTPKKGGKK